MFSISFTEDPHLKVFVDNLENMKGVTKSFREPLDLAVRGVFMPSIEARFVSGGKPQKWTKLSAYTIKRKLAGKYPQNAYKVLINSNSMRRAASAHARWNFTTEQASYAIAPHTPYMVFHLEGTSKMPQRTWLNVTQKDKDKAYRIITKWIENRIKKAGG